MTHIPEGLCQVPGGEGVGRKTLVYQGQSGDHPGVLEVQEIPADIERHQKPFENDDTGREARDVEIRALGYSGVPDFVLCLFSGDKQFAFKLQRIL
jgi:hypothetical protein